MTESRQASTVRRPVIFAAIALVAAAVLLVALRSWLDRPEQQNGIGEAANVAAETEPVEPAFEPEPFVEPATAAIAPPAPAATPIVADVLRAGPMTVIILPARVESSDQAAANVTEAVRQSTLRALRANPYMNVVEISPAELAAIVPPNAGNLGTDDLVYLAVTRRHEGRVVAEISEQAWADSQSWMVTLRIKRPTGGGGSSSTIARNGDTRIGGDAESLGVRFAERIAQDVGRVENDVSSAFAPTPAATDSRNVLLDTTRSEAERLQALGRLRAQGLDGSAIAAAVDLAMRSTSAQTRLRVWTMLRRSAYDPMLAQPLSYALLADADAAVRKEVAFALSAYTGDPAAVAALEHAARNDSSSEVRLAAQMAAMDFDDQQAFKRETLLDRSLTPAERIAPTLVDSAMRYSSSDRLSGAAAAEEALAYAEIVTTVEDPEMKLRGLSELQRMMLPTIPPIARRYSSDDSKIVDAMVETSRHADDRVRRQALNILTSISRMNGNAEARAVLESVLENEPALAAELDIADALESFDRRPAMPGIPPR